MRIIEPEATRVETSIAGLRFEPNLLQALEPRPGWFGTKLLSSPGPLISDFVTHEVGFRYGTYGIHVGQDDRLTFMGSPSATIHGAFVDCRRGSPTLHERVDMTFAPSLARRLLIPRGVAHTFDGLDGVVTRDEPIWYSAEDNPDWNIDNDLISIDRLTPLAAFPVVLANPHRLPDDVHVFQSRLSQSLLESPRTYLARFQVSQGDDKRYVMYDVPDWGRDEASDLASALDHPPLPGVEFRRARYALTGARSWTIVPSTDSCVADVLVLQRTPPGCMPDWMLHLRTRMWYTFLNNEGELLELAFRDCRPGAASLGTEQRLTIHCDPRITVVIDPGVAYSFSCGKDALVRAEQEIFVDEEEPRQDLPIFGQDAHFLLPSATATTPPLPGTRCPGSLVRLLARQEVERAEALLPTERPLDAIPPPR